jgi:hypothetical protein
MTVVAPQESPISCQRRRSQWRTGTIVNPSGCGNCGRLGCRQIEVGDVAVVFHYGVTKRLRVLVGEKDVSRAHGAKYLTNN